MKAGARVGAPKARPTRRASMWVPLEILDWLRGLGAPGMTAHLVAILDAAKGSATASAKHDAARSARGGGRAEGAAEGAGAIAGMKRAGRGGKPGH